MNKDTLKNSIIFKKYKLLSKIGKGSFGYIYSGENIMNNTKIAVKLEEKKAKFHLLELEASFLSILKGQGFPNVISYGLNKKYYILIEELLGEDLGKIKKLINKFSLKDLAMIAIQIIDRIEYVHSKNIVHRDIKPENFLLGLDNKSFLYLIDFGISRKYKSSRGKHLKYGINGKLFGTLRFTSYNATRGVEHSRRDDLESIGYMLVFLAGIKLPWVGYEIRGSHARTNYEKILELKRTTPPEVICGDLPSEFSEYIKYCKSLKFEQQPDYEKLRNLFKQVLLKNQMILDNNFSWLEKLKTDNSEEKKINKKKYINLRTRKQSRHKRLYNYIQQSLNNELSKETKALIENNNIKEEEKDKNKSYSKTKRDISEDSTKHMGSNNSNISKEDISRYSNKVQYDVNIDDLGKSNIKNIKNSKNSVLSPVLNNILDNNNNIIINTNRNKYDYKSDNNIINIRTQKALENLGRNKIQRKLYKMNFNLSLDLDKNFFMNDDKYIKRRCLSEKLKENKKIKNNKEENKRQILCKNIHIKILNKYNRYIELRRKNLIMRKKYKKMLIPHNQRIFNKKNNSCLIENFINEPFINQNYRNKIVLSFNQNLNNDIENNYNSFRNNDNIPKTTIKKNQNRKINRIKVKKINNANINKLINNNQNFCDKRIFIINNNINSFNNGYSSSKNACIKENKINQIPNNVINHNNKNNLNNQLFQNYFDNPKANNNIQKAMIKTRINRILDKNYIIQNNSQNYNYTNEFINSYNKILHSKGKNNDFHIKSPNKSLINNNKDLNLKTTNKIKLYQYKSIIKGERKINNNKECINEQLSNNYNLSSNNNKANQPKKTKIIKLNNYNININPTHFKNNYSFFTSDINNNIPPKRNYFIHKENLSTDYTKIPSQILMKKANNMQIPISRINKYKISNTKIPKSNNKMYEMNNYINNINILNYNNDEDAIRSFNYIPEKYTNSITSENKYKEQNNFILFEDF